MLSSSIVPVRRRWWSAVALVVSLSTADGCVIERTTVFADRQDGGNRDTTATGLDTTTRADLSPLTNTVDLVFVVDNSGSMEQEQGALTRGFSELVAALVSPKFRARLPDLHVGVVSTDLGVGKYTAIPSCGVVGGDKGKLQNTPRSQGCTPPADRFIAHAAGSTNIPGCAADPAGCIEQTFSCIAELGTTGCGFEAPLESARRALDPKRRVNPGFLREDALLVVVFVSDEDDCSARKMDLFDRSAAAANKLGPLSSFRCFEYGIRCDGDTSAAKERMPGTRRNCVPAGDWLYAVDDYIRFFTQLKGARDRVLMAALAGPISPVRVGTSSNDQPTLQPSCQTSNGFAVPAIRLKKVVDAFRGDFSSICSGGSSTGTSTLDFGPALAQLGKRIVARLPGR